MRSLWWPSNLPDAIQLSADLDLKITCLAPADVDATSATSFKRFVVDAGQVRPDTLPALYERALVLTFARVDGNLVGVGAIKRPNPSHREKVFREADSALSPATFTFELGWFHVLPKFEGNRICSCMVQIIMPSTHGSSVYATSTIDKKAMHAALMKHGGFVPEGVEYPSERGDNKVRLFVRRGCERPQTGE